MADRGCRMMDFCLQCEIPNIANMIFAEVTIFESVFQDGDGSEAMVLSTAQDCRRVIVKERGGLIRLIISLYI